MRIVKRGDMLVAIHITGPTHNLLGLRLREGNLDNCFSVTVLPSIGECHHHDGITAEEMIPSILAGVAQANRELGTDFGVEHAEIVENDSRQPAIYEFLAKQIVLKVAAETGNGPPREPTETTLCKP